MKTAYIYKITSPSGKIYIGQTISLYYRKSRYKNCNCKAQPKLYNSIFKYGWENHVFEIIEQHEYCGDKLLLNEREMFWINHFDSFNKGLNCTKGGDGNIGYSVSDEVKKKISDTLTGRERSEEHIKNNVSSRLEGAGYIPTESTKEKIRQAKLGTKHSDETKEKMSKVRKGKKLSDDWRKSISEGRKGYKPTEESIEKRLKTIAERGGIKLTEEQKRARSEQQKGKKRGPYKKKNN